jgi:predicted nucleic acid-binding protein
MKALLDTCIVLDLLIANNDTQYKNANYLFEQAEKGNIEIYLSAMTLFELCSDYKYNIKFSGDKKKIRETKTKILNWISPKHFIVVNVTGNTAERLKEYKKLHDLRPADASIVMSAIFSNVDVLYTTDKKILSKNGVGGLKICKPPNAPQQLSF